ncbi:hypothetical protein O9992_26420 [Vibrio lentus]|nr:hypothetical protein [Vibrio lentus]
MMLRFYSTLLIIKKAQDQPDGDIGFFIKRIAGAAGLICQPVLWTELTGYLASFFRTLHGSRVRYDYWRRYIDGEPVQSA